MQRTLLVLALLLVFSPSSVNAQVLTEPTVREPVVSYPTYKPLEPLPASPVVELPQMQEVAVPAPQAAPVAPSAPVQPVGQVVAGCGDNQYAQYIYAHESGCNTAARNAGGCLGIGQACPGSKLLSICPSLDYACENSFFTAYANSAYGGWSGSYAFWLGHGWW